MNSWLESEYINVYFKNRARLIKSILLSLFWTGLTAFLGLIQLWITIGISYILKNKPYSFHQAVQEGSMLFFIMAVTTAITIDYYFTEELNTSRWVKNIMFSLFPFLIAIFVTALYVALYIADEREVNQSVVITVNYMVIIFTIIYAFAAKLLMFLHEGRNK